MRNLTLKELSDSDNFAEFCDLSNYDLNKIASNLGTNLTVTLVEEDDVDFCEFDSRYPYFIENPFGIDLCKPLPF